MTEEDKQTPSTTEHLKYSELLPGIRTYTLFESEDGKTSFILTVDDTQPFIGIGIHLQYDNRIKAKNTTDVSQLIEVLLIFKTGLAKFTHALESDQFTQLNSNKPIRWQDTTRTAFLRNLAEGLNMKQINPELRIISDPALKKQKLLHMVATATENVERQLQRAQAIQLRRSERPNS